MFLAMNVELNMRSQRRQAVFFADIGRQCATAKTVMERLFRVLFEGKPPSFEEYVEYVHLNGFVDLFLHQPRNERLWHLMGRELRW